jgi:hypothetical protein
MEIGLGVLAFGTALIYACFRPPGSSFIGVCGEGLYPCVYEIECLMTATIHRYLVFFLIGTSSKSHITLSLLTTSTVQYGNYIGTRVNAVHVSSKQLYSLHPLPKHPFLPTWIPP